MTRSDSLTVRCDLGHGLMVERRIATELWNQQERERIIAMRAYDLFCSRGCEHGFHLADWLKAEQDLSPKEDEVLLAHADAGFEISIAERSEEQRLFLIIAPSSLLVLWARAGTDDSEPTGHISYSNLSLLALPGAADPEKAEVAFRHGRVLLSLPHADQAHASSQNGNAGAETDRKNQRRVKSSARSARD